MENRYTSLELSRKLKEAGCELKIKSHWEVIHWDQEITERFRLCYINLGGIEYKTLVERIPNFDILNDICVKYGKEFFGEVKEEVQEDDEFHSVYNYLTYSYIYHTRQILKHLQDGNKQEAETYIWENCLFNPENKEEEWR
jgi:hypothetical protein